jgi:hypothetical protein
LGQAPVPLRIVQRKEHVGKDRICFCPCPSNSQFAVPQPIDLPFVPSADSAVLVTDPEKVTEWMNGSGIQRDLMCSIAQADALSPFSDE